MTTHEEQIAELLRALPAPPQGLVEAAKELPAARRELETIVQRIERDMKERRKTFDRVNELTNLVRNGE